jgi:CBS domain-containing protein
MKRVKDVMTRQVFTIDAADTLANAAERMRVYEVGALPVRDGTRIIGMLTDRDIVTRAVSFDCIPSKTRVAEAMTPSVVRCFEDLPVWRALRMMEEQTVRRLVVITREQAVVGLVSYDDLAMLPPEELEPPAQQAPQGMHMS